MGKKKEEFVLLMQAEGYVLVGIIETWWNESHDSDVVADGYGGGGLSKAERVKEEA